MSVRVKATIGAPITQVVGPGRATFAMVEKAALLNIDVLMRQDMQAARLIMSLIRLMEPGSAGVVVISRQSMAELLGVSLPTVQRALKTLIEGHYVQRIKIGSAYAIAVNKAVAWVGPRGGMDHAVFTATVVASRSEQDALSLAPGELKQLPIAHPSESILAVGNDPEPPFQPGLDGVTPPVALTGDAADRAELEQRGQRRLIGDADASN